MADEKPGYEGLLGLRSPNMQKRALRIILREQREIRKISIKEAAAVVGWSWSKLIRIETGAVQVGQADVHFLLSRYQVPEPERSLFIRLDDESRRPDIWAEYRPYLSSAMLSQYLDFEVSARYINGYENALIPGLLQTKEYAYYVLDRPPSDTPDIASLEALGLPPETMEIDYSSLSDEMNWLLNLRMERQNKILHAEDGPQMNFLIGEAALCYRIGGVSVMRKQIAELRKLALAFDKPQYSEERLGLHIIPFSRGLPRGLQKAFTVFGYQSNYLEDLVATENPDGSTIEYEDSDDFDRFADRFWFFWQMANVGDEELLLNVKPEYADAPESRKRFLVHLDRIEAAQFS